MTYMIQINGEVREATVEEAAAIDAQRATGDVIDAAVQAKIAARQAVLNKLGLTTDEAAALLG